MHATSVGAVLMLGLALIAVRASEQDTITVDRLVDTVSGDRDVRCVMEVPSRLSPGDRTPWQANDIPQTVVVTGGVLTLQFRGGAMVTLEPGDTAAVPRGRWHWHGAAGDEHASFIVRSACSAGDALDG